jgi:aarF domain-containing kinase
MVQGNNQSLSSPVNRIKMIGLWASRSLTSSSHFTFTERLREYYHDLVFRSVLFSLDIAFWITRTKQWVKARIGLIGQGEGFEDELERNMRGFAKSNMGLEISPDAFEG